MRRYIVRVAINIFVANKSEWIFFPRNDTTRVKILLAFHEMDKKQIRIQIELM